MGTRANATLVDYGNHARVGGVGGGGGVEIKHGRIVSPEHTALYPCKQHASPSSLRLLNYDVPHRFTVSEILSVWCRVDTLANQARTTLVAHTSCAPKDTSSCQKTYAVRILHALVIVISRRHKSCVKPWTL